MSTTNNICPPTDKLVHFEGFPDSYWTLQTTGTWSGQEAGYEPEPEPEPLTEEQLAYLEAEFEEISRGVPIEEDEGAWAPPPQEFAAHEAELIAQEARATAERDEAHRILMAEIEAEEAAIEAGITALGAPSGSN